MAEPNPVIPVTAADVGEDFDATASPPPGARRQLAQNAGADPADPGHLATDEEWAAIVARVEGRQP